MSDRDYNRYMDIQQAINLAVHGRLQEEAVAPVRKPAADQGRTAPGGQTRQPGEQVLARQVKPESARDQAQSGVAKRS